MREISYRVDVLRNNVPCGKIQFQSPPTITCDADAKIKLSMRAELLHKNDVDYMHDEIQPIMTLNGKDYPLGVFRVCTTRARHTETGTQFDSVEAYDRAVLLTWHKLEQRDYWQAGTLYTDIISHYLTQAGITSAIIDTNAAVLQTDREDWGIGTDYLTIINALLEEINYTPLWFDLRGTAQVRAYKKPGPGNIAHQFGDKSVEKVLAPAYQNEIDFFSAPNVFIMVLENPEYESGPWVKSAENNMPTSKLSILNRGMRIPEIYKVKNIASEDELQELANRTRDESMQASELVEIQTLAMPNHNPGDTVALTMNELTGIFREARWSMTMQPGAMMSHRLIRGVIV